MPPCLPLEPHLSYFSLHFTSSLHNDRGGIFAQGHETCVCSIELSETQADDVVHGWSAQTEANWMDGGKLDGLRQR